MPNKRPYNDYKEDSAEESGHFGDSPTERRKQLGHRARARRLMLDLSQAGAAAAAGLSVTTYKRLEAGENVNLDVLIRTAIALDATGELDTLFPPIETRSIADILQKNRQRRRGRRVAL